MNIRSLLPKLLSLTALALSFTIGSPVMVAQSADSQEISDLLVEAKHEAVVVADDAATLDSFARSKAHWQTHSARLVQMAEHVNALGKVNKQLSDLKPQGSPWQQQAISQIDPLLRDLAAQLTTTIDHLNSNQSRIHLSPYRDYVAATHESASSMKEMICDFVEYDKAQSKARDLEQKLELTVADNDEPTSTPAAPAP